MIARPVVAELAALAACFAIAPAAAAAAELPNPSTLRASLADPIDKQFVEVDRGTPNTLEGPFDAKAYAAYYQATDPQERQRIIDVLNENGFISGYGREWYRPRTDIWLGEVVLVFTKPDGAAAAASSSKIRYEQSKGFQSFVGAGSIPAAFAVTVNGNGFDWTVVVFPKGNDIFAVAGGSPSDYMTSAVVAQAQKQYAQAPAGTTMHRQPTNATSPLLSMPLLAIVALALMLIVGVTLAIVVFALARPRPHASSPAKP